MYWTYMWVPHIMWKVGLQKNMGHELHSRTSLAICENKFVLRHKMISLANIIQAFLVKYFNKLVTLSRKLLYGINCIMSYLWILIIRVWHNEDKAKYLFPEFHQYFPNTEILVWFMQTRGPLFWWPHCWSLICVFNLVAFVKLHNELYNLDYLQSV